MTRARALAGPPGWTLAFSLFATGCNALIGLTDVPLPADAQAGEPGEAGVPHDGSALDGTLGNSGDGSTVQSSPCGDTQASADNCGRCGHSCLAGQCTMGVCQPIALLAQDAGAAPFALAQDDSFLYWTDDVNSTVARTDKTSGAMTVLTTTEATAPGPIASDDAGIYWGDVIGVWQCPRSGCGVSPTRIAYSKGNVVGVAIDQANLYWSEGSGTLYSAPKTGQGVTAVPLWQGDASTANVAADGQRVYFTATDGLLRGVAVDGSAPFAIGTPNSQKKSFSGVALDGTNVYWGTGDVDDSTLESAPTSSLLPRTLVSQLPGPGTMASDGTTLYWLASVTTDAGVSGGVMACTIASCTPTLLASGYAYVAGLVVDPTAIYWTDNGTTGANGAIWKLAK